MSMAYTPGLKRKEYTILTKTRRLPILGETLVELGEKVKYDTVVARTGLPGKIFSLNVANFLGLEPASGQDVSVIGLKKYMLKKVGEKVKEGEVIARRHSFFGMVKRNVKATTDGAIEHISEISGEVLVREDPIPLNLIAYIPGTVVQVIPKEGVIIETYGAFIQGIFGIGGETHGELKILVDSPDHILTASQITPECAGKVLVVSRIDVEFLEKAVDAKVSGIITGGISNQDLTEFVGYRIGVAITGHEERGLTLIITEGFGDMKIARRTLELLRKFEGQLTCINGATQIRAGVIRPEIIIPTEISTKKALIKDEVSTEGMKPGLLIRIIRKPHFGALAKIVSLPSALKQVETGSYVRVLEAELDDGRRVTVSRANVELIEE